MNSTNASNFKQIVGLSLFDAEKASVHAAELGIDFVNKIF
jgi:hypothetical protein